LTYINQRPRTLGRKPRGSRVTRRLVRK